MRNRVFYFGSICLTFGLFLFLPRISNAINSLDVVISEIAWMGQRVENIEPRNWWRYEWLELYNNTQNPISLNGWKLELYRAELDWSLELNGSILPQNYFFIVASDKIFPIYDLNYSNLGGKFNNSGQGVVLKDGSGNIVDTIDCFAPGKWFAGDNTSKQTMERKDLLVSGNNSNNWGSSQNPGGTPRSKNSIFEEIKISLSPTPTLALSPSPQTSPNQSPPPSLTTPTPLITSEKIIYPSNIVINEVLPAPIGPDETEEWTVATIQQMRINSVYL